MRAVQTQLKAPLDLVKALEPVLPTLGRKGATLVEVWEGGRPGRPNFWMAYVFVDDCRYDLGTPHLKSLPLDKQLSDLVRQLKEFQPKRASFTDALRDGSEVVHIVDFWSTDEVAGAQ